MCRSVGYIVALDAIVKYLGLIKLALFRIVCKFMPLHRSGYSRNRERRSVCSFNCAWNRSLDLLIAVNLHKYVLVLELYLLLFVGLACLFSLKEAIIHSVFLTTLSQAEIVFDAEFFVEAD